MKPRGPEKDWLAALLNIWIPSFWKTLISPWSTVTLPAQRHVEVQHNTADRRDEKGNVAFLSRRAPRSAFCLSAERWQVKETSLRTLWLADFSIHCSFRGRGWTAHLFHFPHLPTSGFSPNSTHEDYRQRSDTPTPPCRHWLEASEMRGESQPKTHAGNCVSLQVPPGIMDKYKHRWPFGGEEC